MSAETLHTIGVSYCEGMEIGPESVRGDIQVGAGGAAGTNRTVRGQTLN